jgi:hypothetical protein
MLELELQVSLEPSIVIVVISAASVSLAHILEVDL